MRPPHILLLEISYQRCYSLAWAELYIMMASICTRVTLEVYETTREDVDIYSDMLIAEPKRYANGVRFRIT